MHAFEVHRVVAARAETAYQTVTLDTYHAALGSELKEVVLQILKARLEDEADIHAAAILFLRDRRHEQFRLVEALIEQVCFRFVALLYPLHAAVLFQPAQRQHGCINRQYRRRVEHRTAVYVRLIVQHRRDITAYLTEAALFDDDEGHTRRRKVLLRTAVDDVVLAHINRTAEDVRTHVGYQRYIAFLAVDLRELLVVDLGTEDGIVRRDVEVISVLRDLIIRWDIRRAGGYFDSFTEAFGFLERFLAPYTGVQVRSLLLQQVKRYSSTWP